MPEGMYRPLAPWVNEASGNAYLASSVARSREGSSRCTIAREDVTFRGTDVPGDNADWNTHSVA
jgi:hypothetical protein